MTAEKTQLETMKSSHDYFSTAVQILTTRVQFYAEEFQGVSNTINFLSTLRDTLKADIEKIEPKQEAKTEPLEMDLTHLKAVPEVTVEMN